MPVLTQLAVSSQPVQQQVIPPAGVNPSNDPVFMAFVPVPSFGPPPDPSPGQFNAATWEVDSNPTTYWASIMVGPANGGVVLAAGAYQIAVKVVDPAATPVLWGWNLLIV